MKSAIVRMPQRLWAQMETLLTRRYPDEEWASFFSFGWREAGDELVVTVADMKPPQPGELDETVSHVRFLEPYTLRAVLDAQQGQFGLGVIHSHPEGVHTTPSPVDDDMDEYYQGYFRDFLGSRPYVSLIFSRDATGRRSFSGRVWFKSEFLLIERVLLVGRTSDSIRCGARRRESSLASNGRTARLAAFYGEDAAERLREATVAVIGVGGSGSAAAHVLARSAVGRLVLVDFDRLQPSNLERLHGSEADHLKDPPLKVELVRDLCKKINPDVEVIPIVGNCLQQPALDWLVRSDVVVGCTDSLHSRIGLSELAYRYLAQVIDVGVQLDGSNGHIRAEVVQVSRYHPGAACIYCRDLVDAWRVSAEFMTEEEKQQRRLAAEGAAAQGGAADAYWRDVPQLLTVGHLTTIAGAFAASYAIGLLAGRFLPPSSFFQFDILADGLGYVPVDLDPRIDCTCQLAQGFADQGCATSTVSIPSHWAPAQVLGT